jgi:RimJ/RimL family protein N-acetyltransferase
MITLRPFSKQDMPSISSWIHSKEELVQYAGPVFEYPLSWEQLEKHLADSCRQVYAAIRPNTTETIGTGEVYWDAEDTPRLCRILVSPGERGKGLGKQIVLSLLELAFANVTVKEVSLNVYDFNTSAIKCYEQCGFKISSDQSIANRASWGDWRALHMRVDRETYQSLLKQAGRDRKPL